MLCAGAGPRTPSYPGEGVDFHGPLTTISYQIPQSAFALMKDHRKNKGLHGYLATFAEKYIIVDGIDSAAAL